MQQVEQLKQRFKRTQLLSIQQRSQLVNRHQHLDQPIQLRRIQHRFKQVKIRLLVDLQPLNILHFLIRVVLQIEPQQLFLLLGSKRQVLRISLLQLRLTQVKQLLVLQTELQRLRLKLLQHLIRQALQTGLLPLLLLAIN